MSWSLESQHHLHYTCAMKLMNLNTLCWGHMVSSQSSSKLIEETQQWVHDRIQKVSEFSCVVWVNHRLSLAVTIIKCSCCEL